MSTVVQAATLLFAGRPEFLGGLTNEEELAKACPGQFRDDNSWSNYTMQLFFRGGTVSNWEWKSDDKAERTRQFNCFHGLLGTFGLSQADKEAVAGWMLSEMLKEVPEYIPPKK